MTASRVAVLGAGIMGSCVALNLADGGVDVCLYDQDRAPMGGASRWNEGKIHLGYLYGADPSLATARRVLDGGLAFGPLIEDLIGSGLEGHMTDADDVYVIHRDSVVDADAAASYFDAVSAMVRDHPDAARYLTDASQAEPRRLRDEELASFADPGVITAGFAVPERSVDTRWVADRLVEALDARNSIERRMGAWVTAASPTDGHWTVACEGASDDSFDVVVNALWHGRPAIDVTAGLRPEATLSHRYRASVFARTTRPLSVPSVVVGVGPFGDVKNYNGRDFYVSWYPDGLLAESEGVHPQPPPVLSDDAREQTIRRTIAHLAELLPPVAEVLDAAETLTLGGGYVFAVGSGSLADPASSLHRRDRFGVRRRPGYWSVDTGKYSTAPWLARTIAAEILDL